MIVERLTRIHIGRLLDHYAVCSKKGSAADVAALYTKEANVTMGDESWRGRDEIEVALNMEYSAKDRPQLKAMVESVVFAADRCSAVVAERFSTKRGGGPEESGLVIMHLKLIHGTLWIDAEIVIMDK